MRTRALRAGWAPVAAALALAACAGPKARTLGAADAGAVVPLAPGQALELRLAGNPTTGYLWEVAAADPAVLAPQGEPEHRPDSDRPGAGGVTTFRWRAAAAGRTPLALVYRRPWEKEVPPAARWEATVMVESTR